MATETLNLQKKKKKKKKKKKSKISGDIREMKLKLSRNVHNITEIVCFVAITLVLWLLRQLQVSVDL